MNQIPIDFARASRDIGMQRAADHAERVSDGWTDRAFDALCRFAKQTPSFTSFEFRQAVKDSIDAPPTPKAFGPIFSRAAKAGVIRKTGYVQHPERHCSPTPVWVAI